MTPLESVARIGIVLMPPQLFRKNRPLVESTDTRLRLFYGIALNSTPGRRRRDSGEPELLDRLFADAEKAKEIPVLEARIAALGERLDEVARFMAQW